MPDLTMRTRRSSAPIIPTIGVSKALAWGMLVWGMVLGTGCKPHDAETAAPEVETAQTVETAGVPSVASLDAAALEALPMPDPATLVQTCDEDAACRVYQPSDWSADVACCYEYGCGLDYVAINQDMWALIRAWREVHAFDCVAHAQENGPCNNRAISCGLDQEPPTAACIEGICQVVYPDVWPIVIPEAQSCNMNNDCDVMWTGRSFEQSCCDVCQGEQIAVNRQTLEAFGRWAALGGCDGVECPTGGCTQPTAEAQCVAGRCVIP